MDIRFCDFIVAYNKAARKNGVRDTTTRAMVRRLNNADCGFNFANGMISDKQLQALFVYSYKGNREKKAKIMMVFNHVAEVFMLPFNFFDLGVAVEQVQEKEVKVMARAIKKTMDRIMFKTTLSKAVMVLESNNHVLDNDADRIEAAREAIMSLEDKSMLAELFISKVTEEEFAC